MGVGKSTFLYTLGKLILITRYLISRVGSLVCEVSVKAEKMALIITGLEEATKVLSFLFDVFCKVLFLTILGVRP